MNKCRRNTSGATAARTTEPVGVHQVEQRVTEHADEQASSSPPSLIGPSLPGRNLSQSQMIATAIKGITTSPPMPWVKPRWKVRGESPTAERSATAVDVRQVGRDDQRRHRPRASGA